MTTESGPSGADDSRARYGYGALEAFARGALEHCGMDPADAAIGARVVLDADLSGIETHGISNLVGHWHYVPGLRDGTVAARPRITVLRDSPVAAAWDAGRGFGPVVAQRAMDAAMDKAGTTGVGLVTVRDGCHFGAIGYFARLAAERGLIGAVACHTAPTAVAPGGRERLVGTNPLAFAAPVAGRHPLCFDMAATAAAGTKVQVARRRGEPIPAGWAVDAEGRPTTDSAVLAEGGALVTLGTAEGAGHKGFGLALVVDVLSGVLSGTGSGLFTTFGPQWRQGALLAALRVDAFADPEEFGAEMRRMVDGIHASAPAPGHGPVLVPGDRGAAARADRLARGVPLDEAVAQQCRELAAKTGVPFPEPLPAGAGQLPAGAGRLSTGSGQPPAADAPPST